MLADLPVDMAPAPDSMAVFSIAHIRSGAPFHGYSSCRGDGEEIVVCGRRGESRYRLQPLPPSGIAPPDPDMPLGVDLAPNLRLGLHGGQSAGPNGWTGVSLMLGLRLRF